MQLLSTRKRAAIGAARRGLSAYGTFKHAQGRISARPVSARRLALAGVAGSALAGVAGFLLAWHLKPRAAERGDISTASVDEQRDAAAQTPVNGDRSGALTR